MILSIYSNQGDFIVLEGVSSIATVGAILAAQFAGDSNPTNIDLSDSKEVQVHSNEGRPLVSHWRPALNEDLR